MKRKSFYSAQSGFAIIELVLIAVVIASLVGVGSYVYRKNDSQQASLRDNGEIEQVEELPEDLSEVIGFEKVKDVAMQDNADDQIVDIDLESEDGAMVFVVKMKSGKIFYIDAKSAAVVKTTDGEPNDDAVLPNNLTGLISVAQARAIAVEKNPGAKVIKIELELDDGDWEYEVKFSDGVKVEVDASKGNVTKVKKEKIESGDDDDDRSGSSNGQDEDDDDGDSSHSRSDGDRDEDDDDGNDDDNSDDDEDEDEDEEEDETEDEDEEEDDE